MNNLILKDEISLCGDAYKSYTQAFMHPRFYTGVKTKGRFLYKDIYVVTDCNPFAKYIISMFSGVLSAGLIDSLHCITVEDADLKYDCGDYENVGFESFESFKGKTVAKRSGVFVFADCKDGLPLDKWTGVLTYFADICAAAKESKIIVSAIMPEFPAAPDEINGLAEREFSYYYEVFSKEHSADADYYFALEKLCRSLVKKNYYNINLLRFFNVFGPDCNMLRFFDLDGFVRSAFESGKVEIKPEDYESTYSVTFVRNAFMMLVKALYMGRNAQVYNAATLTASIAEIKNTVHKSFSDKLALKAEANPVESVKYFNVNTMKLYILGWTKKNVSPLASALQRVCFNILDDTSDNRTNIAVYGGRLKRIKSLEMMMLREIDQICRENGIKYFLCGGTMLGSIRYGHSIPWDDDLDIGMLRPDFDKFTEVVMKNEKYNKLLYNYSSHRNDSGSHYIVDKIRLNGTYFSTRYSSVHQYDDGLFIDILVYDQTSDILPIAKLHSYATMFLSKFTELRWYGKPRAGQYYVQEIATVPFINLLPIDFYHKLFDFNLQLFKNKKDAKYVIDSTGKLQRKGPFLKQGLEDVQYVDFDEGFKAPIPVDYTNYLTFDYGPNYLPEPPLTKRAAPHNFARIDLGEYIIENKDKPEFRELNVFGELYENDD